MSGGSSEERIWRQAGTSAKNQNPGRTPPRLGYVSRHPTPAPLSKARFLGLWLPSQPFRLFGTRKHEKAPQRLSYGLPAALLHDPTLFPPDRLTSPTFSNPPEREPRRAPWGGNGKGGPKKRGGSGRNCRMFTNPVSASPARLLGLLAGGSPRPCPGPCFVPWRLRTAKGRASRQEEAGERGKGV